MLFKKLKRRVNISIVNFLNGTRFYGIKRKLLNSCGIHIGKNTNVVGPIFVGTVAELSIGENCFVGRELKILGNGSVHVGNNVDLAPDISFITGSHEIGDCNHRAGRGISFCISVKDGAWIGARTTILGNTVIGSGVVVGASSLICKDVSDNCLVAGVPARIIRNLDKNGV